MKNCIYVNKKKVRKGEENKKKGGENNCQRVMERKNLLK